MLVGDGDGVWLAASYLNAALNPADDRGIDITVITPGDDTEGFGRAAATLPGFQHHLATIGVDESALLHRAAATIRYATRHEDWLDGDGEHFYLPYGRDEVKPIDNAALRWLQSDRSIPYAATAFLQPLLCDAGLAPRGDAPGAVVPVAYGYHIDRPRFADLLRDRALQSGVTWISEALAGVDIGAADRIDALQLANGRQIAGDLFVDCTGHDARLIAGLDGTGWVADSAPTVTAAVSLELPVADDAGPAPVPYSRTRALAAGWLSELPLQDRHELCYRYTPEHCDAAEAEAALRAAAGPAAADAALQRAQIRSGLRTTAWTGNCVALGDAAASTDGLAADDLHLVATGARLLAEHFPRWGHADELAYRYNQLFNSAYYEVRDFGRLQCALSRRGDSAFWRAMRDPDVLPARLRSRLDYWRRRPPSPPDFEDGVFPGDVALLAPEIDTDAGFIPLVAIGELFDLHTTEALLYGMDFLRDECDAWFGSDRPASELLPAIAAATRQAPAALPAYAEWLATASHR